MALKLSYNKKNNIKDLKKKNQAPNDQLFEQKWTKMMNDCQTD